MSGRERRDSDRDADEVYEIRRPLGVRIAIVTAVVSILGGCALFAGTGGPGLAQQRPGETYPGARQELSGDVQVTDKGCIELAVDGTAYFVIWPTGSELDDLLRLPDGTQVRSGNRVVGTGAYTDPKPLVRDQNGYWASVLGFCAPNATNVVVFDTVRRSTDQ